MLYCVYNSRSNNSLLDNYFENADSGYNDFKRLYAIESIGAYFMDRGEENYDLRSVKWKRRILSGSGILSDAISYMDGQLIWESIPTRSGE